MTIERIGAPDPVSKFNKTEKAQKPKKSETADSINVSADARSKAEVYSATETAKMSPDVRMSRINEVKQKLADPSYISEKLVDDLAERLMRYFEL